MMNEIIIMVIGQDCENTIEMCLRSCRNELIFYLDGGSKDNTLNIVKKIIPEENILYNKWINEDIAMNGKQRNFYLKFLKEKYLNKWCLVLDADEILEDYGIEKLKEIAKKEKTNFVFSPRIHHFIGDIGHEDFTRDIHFVPNRIFKITKDLKYPEIDQHPVLLSDSNSFNIDIHIWHFRECLGIFSSLNKSLENAKKSKTHSASYLNWWHRAMLFGEYPKKKVYYKDIPTIIKQRFRI